MVLPVNGLSCVRRLGEGGEWRAQIKDHDLSHSLCNSILLLPCLMVYYYTLFLFCFYCFCLVSLHGELCKCTV